MAKQASATQLREQTQQLDVIFQAVEDGITVQDKDGQLVYANAAAAWLLGYETAEELLATPAFEILSRYEVYDETGRPISADELPGRKALLGERQPEQILGFRVLATGEESWAVVRSAPIFEDKGDVALVVNVFADVTQRKRAEDERERLLASEHQARQQAEELRNFFSFLAEAGKVLASSLDYETTLTSVANLAVPHIADWCGIHIVEEDGSVQQLAVAHVDPAKVELARELERRIPFDPEAVVGAPNVLRTGQPELISEIPDELLGELIEDPELLAIIRELGLRSSMVVPLSARGHVLGAISLISAESGHLFGPRDLALAEELASRAALAVDNARLFRRTTRTAAELTAILEHMADGVVMLDASGTVVFMNRVGEELAGRQTREASLDELVVFGHTRDAHDEPLEVPDTALGRALRGEAVLNAERHLSRPDGSEVVVRISASPVTGQDGSVAGAVGVFHDITAERTLEQQKEAFLAAAAHDLKTPLSTVKGLAQVMQRRLSRIEIPDSERLAHSMSQIDDAVTRMNRLVNDLLDASRLEMDRPLELNLAAVDLVALIDRIVREARHNTNRHHVRLDTDLPELVGRWDGDRLDRVFSNLISNAIKYSPEGGEVLVSIRIMEKEGERLAAVSVRDQGVGIPADDQERIFERFFRAGNVRSRIQGTGIGLASARYITDQHDGGISVQSEEGKGATFEVRLPIR